MTAFTDRSKLTGALEGEEGAAMAEYAVALGVISITIVAVFAALSGAIVQMIDLVVGVFTG